MELHESLVVALCLIATGLLAGEPVRVRWCSQLGAPQERRQLAQQLQTVEAAHTDRSAVPVELAPEIDERSARKIDPLVNIVADEVVECRPPKQRADHAGPGDRQLERALRLAPQRHARPVPEADVRVDIEAPGQFLDHTSRRRELSSGLRITRARVRFPRRHAVAGAAPPAASMIAATPIPPAVQIEMRPRPLPFSASSFARLAAMRAPVAANG